MPGIPSGEQNLGTPLNGQLSMFLTTYRNVKPTLTGKELKALGAEAWSHCTGRFWRDSLRRGWTMRSRAKEEERALVKDCVERGRSASGRDLMQDSWSISTARQGVREKGRHASPRDRHERRGLSQRLNRLEFIVGVDGSSVFPHRGEKAVVNDASRV